jgi:nicotinamidase-related amidase
MLTDKAEPILLPIDVQMGFDYAPWTRRAPDNMEANGQSLLAHWRNMGWPIIHVRHASKNQASPLHASHAGHAFRPGFEPRAGETEILKSVNSAFIGTNLSEQIEELWLRPLVMFGVSGDMCVSTTARMAANLGYDVTAVSDACWCFDLPGPNGSLLRAEDVLAVHMATLAFEFCAVKKTSEILSSGHS